MPISRRLSETSYECVNPRTGERVVVDDPPSAAFSSFTPRVDMETELFEYRPKGWLEGLRQRRTDVLLDYRKTKKAPKKKPSKKKTKKVNLVGKEALKGAELLPPEVRAQLGL